MNNKHSQKCFKTYKKEKRLCKEKEGKKQQIWNVKVHVLENRISLRGN